MTTSVPHRHLWSPDRLSSADLQALLETEAELQRAQQRGDGWGPLRGRHLALLIDRQDESAPAFQRAVHDLGGSVALLDANDWQSSAGGRVPDAARLLGRLYDAIDCCDLPAALVEQIETHSGVPVFNGVARPDHPLRRWIDASAAQRRLAANPSAEQPQCLLQALLVCAIQ